MAKTSDSLSSVSNAIRLLQEFSIEERELGISELSARLGLAKSTVYRLMKALKDANLVEKNEETQKYHLGIGAFELGFKVYHSLEIRKVALPLVEQLVKRTRRVVRLAMYDQGGIVYLCKRSPEEDDPTISKIGSKAPSFCTACGRVLLAHQSEEELNRVIKGRLKKFTNSTKTSPEELLEEINVVKEKGYSITIGEYRENIASIAVPVYNDYGSIIASISITGNEAYFSGPKVQTYITELKMHSRLITEKLGLEFAL